MFTAAFPQALSAASTFTAPESDGSSGSPPTPVQFNWSQYQDQPGGLQAVLTPAAGVFWESVGLYLHVDEQVDAYDVAGSHMSSSMLDVATLDRFQGFPTGSQFAIDFAGTITRSCAGSVAYVYQPALGGRAFQMTVGPDGRTGLITVHDGATTFDVVRIYADGRIEHLSTDGSSMLPHWQP